MASTSTFCILQEIKTRLRDKCQHDECEVSRRRSAFEIERLQEKTEFAQEKCKKMKKMVDEMQLKFNYASSMQSHNIMEKLNKITNFRGYNLLSAATVHNRVQSNETLLQQGVGIIDEAELSIGLLIGKGPNSNDYDALFKEVLVL